MPTAFERLMRWRMSSESAAVWKMAPSADRAARISAAFEILPLCASAMRPLVHSTARGWALRSPEPPSVE